MSRLALILATVVLAAGCSAGAPDTAESTAPAPTSTTEAPTTTTTEAETTTSRATTTTTEAVAGDGSDSPGDEQVGVGDKVTITILDEDGNVVGP